MPAKSKLKISSEGNYCSNCIHAKELLFREELLCTKKGVVPLTFKCRNHSVDITNIAMPRRHLNNFKKLTAEDFSIK